MSQYRIAVVVGSLRNASFNRQLADAIVKLAPPEFSFEQLDIGDLPLYNQDDDANQAESVKRLKARVAASRGLVFVTAEYNRSIPDVLKNAIDHASPPYGHSAWAGKPAGVLGVSSAPSARLWHSSTCAICSLISTCRRWPSLKASSIRRRACSTRRATLARTVGSSSRAGWTTMLHG